MASHPTSLNLSFLTLFFFFKKKKTFRLVYGMCIHRCHVFASVCWGTHGCECVHFACGGARWWALGIFFHIFSTHIFRHRVYRLEFITWLYWLGCPTGPRDLPVFDSPVWTTNTSHRAHLFTRVLGSRLRQQGNILWSDPSPCPHYPYLSS